MGFLDRVRAVRDTYQQVDANIERCVAFSAFDLLGAGLRARVTGLGLGFGVQLGASRIASPAR